MCKFLRYPCIAVVAGGLLAQVAGSRTSMAKEPEKTLLPARQVTVRSYVELPPTFATSAKTLDPVEIVSAANNGYLTRMCEPWGMQPGLEPTIRFFFDNRILPWPEMKHHGVDGFDNNNRNLGAHALSREMLGDEKDNRVEQGQLAYLLGITDPGCALPYSPDSLPRHCSVGHGELAKNVMLYYEQTNERWLREWAERILRTLRQYAFVRNVEGVGMIAEYHQGGKGGQGGFNVGDPPKADGSDTILDGWQHLYAGWNCWAFAKWHELTGDEEALDFAVALGNRLCHGNSSNGDDGSLRADGSFGGTTAGSLQMHGHTHGLIGLALLGKQLIQTGQREKGIQFISQVDRTYDWLFDASRNPDAGSMTGWLPEFLCVNGGWDRKGDCEGCTMGDMVQLAVALGEVSELDPQLAEFTDYYDRAEQIYRGQVVESIFHLTPEYMAVLKECLVQRVDKEMPKATSSTKAEEVNKRLEQAVATAKRMEGRLLGLCGFPDWVNHYPSPLDAELPGIDMMGCCADAVIRASHAIWSHTVTGDDEEIRVNLAFNHASPQVDVISSLPHRGEVNVIVKSARNVLVRVPEWASKDKAKTYVDQEPVAKQWQGSYVVFNDVTAGQQLTVTYPLRIAEVKETIYGREHVRYTEKWRGNTIVDIAPAGEQIPMFMRPGLDTDQVPQ